MRHPIRSGAVVAIALGMLSTVGARQQPPPAQTGATFRAVTRLIAQAVTVKDKDGRPVEGLTVNDFVVTEDGEPQKVSFAEFQRLPTTPVSSTADAAAEPVPPPAPVAPRPSAAPGLVAAPTDVKIATSAPGDIRYRNRRLLVLVFRHDVDGLAGSVARLQRGAEIHLAADDNGRSHRGDCVSKRGRPGEAGLHRRERSAAGRRADARLRQGRRWRRHAGRARGGHGLRPGRCRVRDSEYRPPVVGAADGGRDAAPAARSEGAASTSRAGCG